MITESELIDVFKNNLVTTMEEKGYSQKDLSYETGLSEMTISRYVNGQSMPKLSALFNIAMVLDCELEELVGYVDMVTF